MLIRHRTPTIFSIYMVDIMCCALGCVILLWQVNRQEAEAKTEKLQEAHIQITNLDDSTKGLEARLKMTQEGKIKVELELQAAMNRNQKLALVSAQDKEEIERFKKLHLGEIEKNEMLAVVLAREKDELGKLRKTHEDALAVLSNLKIEVADLQKDKARLEVVGQKTSQSLSEKTEAYMQVLKKIADAEGKIVLLEKDVADRKIELTETEKKLRDLLADKQAELVVLLDSLKKSRVEKELLATTNKSLSESLKEYDFTKLKIALLQNEKKSLISRAQAAENRFAGLTLTGKRVLLLVDMSGSMDLIDSDTPDPDKWPKVCDTVARIMESLPDLEYFQVILFSDKIRYPVGEKGRFLKVTAKENGKQVASILKGIKPEGGTNMYDAFDEAFKFRDQGLDTIYVFSDGLPNMGDGLPLNSQGMTETQKTEILSKHVRARLKNVWNRPNPDRVKINTIGFFFESPEVGAFLWAMARENNGGFVGMHDAGNVK